MKSIRPHIINNWQPLGLLGGRSSVTLPFHQRIAHNVTCSVQTLPRRSYSSSSGEFYQESCRRPLVSGCTFSHPSIQTVRSKFPQHTLQTRAAYTTQRTTTKEPIIHDIFETQTGTWQYVVADPSTLTAVIIDPVLDYDPTTQIITTSSADQLLSLIKEKNYKIDRILETHVHADHITAATYLQKRLGAEQGQLPPISIGKRIGQVQTLFSRRYSVPREEYENVFEKLFDDDETFSIGELWATAIHLPGHTPDHLGYKIGDNVFCGDSLFNVDIGTARCDFPGGSANDLYNSGRKLLSLPDHVKIWPGHDYPPEGRGPVPWISVKAHREKNTHLNDKVTEDEFVTFRKERDAKLAEPRLLHQSLQMNIRAGRLPKPTESGHRMLHLPLKLRVLEW
ncbi:hypothetical protein DTO271G3_428 [Paecilomyces variotii]|nr:hypothetical protein DTO271G3_428 [Paecilomyces variotii]